MADVRSQWSVFTATQLGHAPILKELVFANGAHSLTERTRTEKGGKTPLHVAVESSRLEEVKLLLKLGADPNADVDWVVRKKPLHIAVEAGNQRMCKLLLRFGADPNARIRGLYWTEWTPLHIAAHKGNIAIIKLLLSFGADVNIPNASGFLPIHLTKHDNIKFLLARAIPAVSSRASAMKGKSAKQCDKWKSVLRDREQQEVKRRVRSTSANTLPTSSRPPPARRRAASEVTLRIGERRKSRLAYNTHHRFASMEDRVLVLVDKVASQVVGV